MKVFIYWNLHKQCWSIRAQEGEDRGRVIGHAHAFQVTDPMFKVSEAGRQRVLATKRKLVHAGIVGELTGVMWFGGERANNPFNRTRGGTPVTYSPYRGPSFTAITTRERVGHALLAQGFHDRTVLAKHINVH